AAGRPVGRGGGGAFGAWFGDPGAFPPKKPRRGKTGQKRPRGTPPQAPPPLRPARRSIAAGGPDPARLRRRFCDGYHPPMTAPGKGRFREVQRRLRAEQGPFVPKPVLPVIDEVVATVLSQHTSDTNSERAFAQLKERFSNWEQVAAAPAGQVADAIRCGGIADQKARRIQQILAAISEREGRIDLGRLHHLGDAAARTYLESLPGVGPKTAACVLTFAMGRAAFPVDPHVHRVATRLGWLPAKTAADRAHRLLGPMVPADIRYDLHVAMISHGRTVCRAQRPRCAACVLNDLCAYGRQSAAPAGQRQPPAGGAGPGPAVSVAARTGPRSASGAAAWSSEGRAGPSSARALAHRCMSCPKRGCGRMYAASAQHSPPDGRLEVRGSCPRSRLTRRSRRGRCSQARAPAVTPSARRSLKRR